MRVKKELKENSVGHVRLAQEAISDFVRNASGRGLAGKDADRTPSP